MSIESVYQSLLRRSPDQGAYATYSGWSDEDIANAIYGSQEYANLQQQSQPQDQGQPQEQQQIPTGGGGGNPQADLNALYQQYLGRGVDPSGAATFAGMDTQSVINAILGSQEYANRQGGGGGGGGSGNNAYVPGPSYGEYNFEMTGKPSDAELATNSDMANAWYKYSGTAPPPAMTWETAPDVVTAAPGLISFYGAYGLPKPFSEEDIRTPVDPKTIRYGYGNTPYAGVKSNIPGLMSGGEYIVDPKTNKFVLDANGNPMHVPIEPYKKGTWTTIMDDYVIPAFLATAAYNVLPGVASNLFGGFGSLGGAAELGSEFTQFGPTYGELGYTGLEPGQFGPTYGELGYTGLSLGADSAAANAAAAAYAAQQAAPGIAKTLGTTLSTASTIAKLLTNSQATNSRSPNISPFMPTALRNVVPTGIMPTGTMPTSGSTPIQVNAGSNQSALPGIYGEQFSPFAFGNQQPVQTPKGGGYDFLSALNKPVDTSLFGQMKNVSPTNSAQNQAQNAKLNFFSSLLS